jgi:hypothetical protein
MKPWLLTICLALVALSAVAQKSSPEIHADRTVTFQVRAPNATNVAFSFESSKSTPMEKGDGGMWRLTVGPLAPNIYAYSFWIDGIRVADLGSPAVKPEPMPVSSMFEVMSDRPQIFDDADRSQARHPAGRPARLAVRGRARGTQGAHPAPLFRGTTAVFVARHAIRRKSTRIITIFIAAWINYLTLGGEGVDRVPWSTHGSARNSPITCSRQSVSAAPR